ncbi:ABC transporter ATP-binding protein [Agrococcus sp. KRD186]|uniref:ABC transporter ATP-binding protein n=1 Tax=Agrococcus sp. KRD186 TaxID=2729730 RepID=UPI0019D01B2E|nr:ABC transporter ATP-binding protein [Agrococcus sp. KRD186]
MGEAAVEVHGVSKKFRVYHDRNQSIKATVLKGGRAKYEEFWALRDVSLEVPKGTTFGLLGLNGSGKSTLLKCIAGILQPNAGHIVTRGRMAAMLEVGSGFHPELSGRENIYLNAAILGMSDREVDAKIDSIIDFAGVERFIDHPVKNYSSGMYVRLGFSVAIHTQPELLLVDEVLAVGDKDFQAKCLGKFEELKAAGKTVVVVSHSMGTMRTFCDRAAWLEQGVLQDVGDASAIVDDYSGSGSGPGPGPQAPSSAALGDRTVHISAVRVLRPDNEEPVEVGPAERLRIRVEFEARERILDPVFTLSITNAPRWVLHRMLSTDYGWDPGAIEPGAGAFEVEIDSLPLVAGEYDINIDIRPRGSSLTSVNAQGAGTIRVGSTGLVSSRSSLALPARFTALEQG